ncbi:hypothetical protein D9M72_577290 [compost metagenome]
MGHDIQRRRRQGIGNRVPIPYPRHHADAEPAKDQRTDAVGMGECQEGRDACAHRVAHHMCFGDAEMSQKRYGVARHLLRMIKRWIVGFTALAMPAVVERDHTVAGIAQRLQPARKNPVDVGARGKPMNEKNGCAGWITFVEEGNLQAFMGKVGKRRRIEIHLYHPGRYRSGAT